MVDSVCDTATQMGRIKKIHFVGIGGAGMSGIAEVLYNQGYLISGSDNQSSDITNRLIALGAKVFIGHKASQVDGADAVVVSSAISKDNPEYLSALENRIPVVQRAEMLAELMRYRYGIAVAGTHGKTTTTSLIASVFYEAQFDPTFIIGGLLNSSASNAKLGASRYLIAEADESDASFLHLQPMLTVLTNVDRDHLVNYEGSFKKLQQAFIKFIHNLPFYGLLVACIDDPITKVILSRVNRPIITYGFDEQADYRATDYKQNGFVSTFTVRKRNDPKMAVSLNLNMPGAENVQNALASFAVASEEGIAIKKIISGIESFGGVSRRFQHHGTFSIDQGEFMLVDDYGHHPNEVRSVIAAIRNGWPDSRLIMVYQPHRYSRTLEMFESFVDVLSSVDHLFLLETYSAGEEPLDGAGSKDLFNQLKLKTSVAVEFVESIQKVPLMLESRIRPGDLVVTQGAGETAQIARSLTKRWRREKMFS